MPARAPEQSAASGAASASRERRSRARSRPNSSSDRGSNYLNTTLLVTFDEHGGTFDHVPPPAAVPQTARRSGPDGLHLRSLRRADSGAGNSAWVPEQTVITGEHRATSLLATMRERWNLGPPFTAREASAPSFSNIFTLDSPRAQEDWPEKIPRPVPEMPESVVPLDAPLGLLGKSLLLSVLAMGKERGMSVPELKPEDTITGAPGGGARSRAHGGGLPEHARLTPRCRFPFKEHFRFRVKGVVRGDGLSCSTSARGVPAE